jgi:hypothetical protein
MTSSVQAQNNNTTKPKINITLESGLKDVYEKDEEANLRFKIQGEPLNFNDINKINKKEIVLAIDSSESMKFFIDADETKDDKYNYADKYENSRMYAIENAAISFVDKMASTVKNDGDKIKIGIVTYNKTGNIEKIGQTTGLVPLKGNEQNLKDTIINIKNGIASGTNIGDGLRLAGGLLKQGDPDVDKYIVFMTDGFPNKEISKNGNYYKDLNTVEFNDNNYGYQVKASTSTAYPKEIGKLIKQLGISTYSIAFANKTGAEKLKDIASTMDIDKFYSSYDVKTLQDIYSKIANNISSDYTVQNLNDSIKNEFLISKEYYNQNNEKVDLSLNYYLNDDNTKYICKPIYVDTKFKVSKESEDGFNIAAGLNATYTDLNGQAQTAAYPEVIVKTSTNDVTMKVTDSSGQVDPVYNIKSGTSNYDQTIKNAFGQDVRLFGDSYANISFNSKNINQVKYQFIKSDETPDMPDINDENWKVIEGQGFTDDSQDIDISKRGYLTQKSYDVSHMATQGDREKWENRNEVFKYPFEASNYKPAGIAKAQDGPSAYVQKEEYVDKDGVKKVRWIPNSVFTENQRIGEFGANDYKEANKTWGYIKVPQNGYYTFQTKSDDGLYATITVGDQSNVLVDDMTPHQQAYHYSKEIYLESNKYYPIYLEYFNWGGEASYSIQYIVNSVANKTWGNQYKDVPKECFYPSKSSYPGEGSTNKFTGQAGVKFPEQSGKYYIVFKGINGSTQINQGTYGPFTLDDRFSLERSIINNEANKVLDEYKIQYKIMPNDIRVTDIYKTPDKLVDVKDKLFIQNIQFTDIIPDGMTVKDCTIDDSTGNFKLTSYTLINNKLQGFVIGNIEYDLNNDETNIENAVYKAQGLNIILTVVPTEAKNYEFKDKDGVLCYKDVSLNEYGPNKESKFSGFKFRVNAESTIGKHGSFKDGTVIEPQNGTLALANQSNYNLGMEVTINSNNSKLDVEVPDSINLQGPIVIYKVTESGLIQKGQIDIIDGQKQFSKTFNDFTEEDLGSTYIISYKIIPNIQSNSETALIQAKLDSNQKNLQLNITNNSKINYHGMYINDTISDQSNVSMSQGFKYKMGVDVTVNSSKSILKIETQNNVTISDVQIYDKNSGEAISGKVSSDSNNKVVVTELVPNTSGYIVVYNIEPVIPIDSTSIIKATIDNNSKNVNFTVTKAPELY